MDHLTSTPVPHLDTCDRDSLLNYFDNSWELEEILMQSLRGEETFYTKPDPLRNPLVFYLGHSAAFYINKLVRVGVLDQGINPGYETLFEQGVDPATSDDLDQDLQSVGWPQLDKVWQYRDQVREQVEAVIHNTPLNLPIGQSHPLWALMMGMEHNRIHFETSSMLIRQLPLDQVGRPPGWCYALTQGKGPDNAMIPVAGGETTLGKPNHATTYGWDSEYGNLTLAVKPFLLSQYLVTNGEFLQFVADQGYDNPDYWDQDAWEWKTQSHTTHPKFWIPYKGSYQYRAMFDQIDLPLDWPVEVNHHEAIAYCRWQGNNTRLMTEAEWNVAIAAAKTEGNYNLNLKFGSPTPVGDLETDTSASGLSDLRGNVWEWLGDDFNPLPGFQPHPLYEDYSTPYFDPHHKLMVGGAWASTGTYASPSCRNWFRRNFFQHAGFRIAQDI